MTRLTIALAFSVLAAPALAQPLSSAFTYQGEIASNGIPFHGMFDVRFALFDAPAGGNQLGSEFCFDNLIAERGRITTTLNFGPQFNGATRYLQIRLREDTNLAFSCLDPSGFTLLEPRQRLTAAPNAAFALDASALNNQPASFYTDASNLSSGTIPDARLPSDLPRLATSNSFTGVNQFNGFTGVNRNFALSGAEVFGLQNLPAQNGYVGMYVNSTALTGLPFYGYAVNGQFAWTMHDPAGTWHVFNNNYSLSVTNAGNVGIGTTTPARRLDVAGAARASDFEYAAPQTSFYMVSQAAFSGRDGTPVNHSGGSGGAWPASPTVNGIAAPVNLPHGSTITAITYYVFDGFSNADLNLSLTYQSGTSSSFTSAASVSTNGTNPNIQTFAVTGLNIPIDHSLFGYQIVAHPSATWSTFNMLVKSVRIEYTLPRPAR